MDRSLLRAGSLLGFLGVGAGAFGAHALLPLVGQDRLQVWQTGAHYHLIHAVAILFAALAGARTSGWLWVAGTVVFAGSLYLLTVTGVRALGMITPIGGVLFLLGWLFLLVPGQVGTRVSGSQSTEA